MKIGQVVNFRKEILDVAKPNTPVGNIVNEFKGEELIVTYVDKYGFVKLNDKDELINPIWLAEV